MNIETKPLTRDLKDDYLFFFDNMIFKENPEWSNEKRVKDKIKELEMDWTQGIITKNVNNLLNPQMYFPGILLFDDKMRLIVRDRSKSALVKVRSILKK